MAPEEQKPPQGHQPIPYTVHGMQQDPAMQAPAGYPGAAPPMQPGQPYYAQPLTQQVPQGYIAQPVMATYHPPPTMTLSEAISPEELKKIRKMTWVNFAFTMLQLGCSLAVILILTNHLEGARWVSTPAGPLPSYYCYFSTTNSSSPCRYAYSLASVSIFWGFMLSMIQCLTLDCCGMGRLVEMMFDIIATAWWMAGAITLTAYHREAEAANIPQSSAREGVIAMCWIAAGMFLCLAVTNGILMKKYGKALKRVKAQQHAASAGMPTGQPMHVVQMGPPPAGYNAGAAAYPTPAPGWGAPPAPQGYAMPPPGPAPMAGLPPNQQ